MDEFIHTLFLPVVERDLSYVEGMVDMMLGGMAEVASGLNHEQSIIGVNVKEFFFFYSQSPHLIRCAGGEKYQELSGDMYLAVIV